MKFSGEEHYVPDHIQKHTFGYKNIYNVVCKNET